MDERSFFTESDDWIFERVLRVKTHYADPDISFVALEHGALPRSLAVGYSLYLAIAAKKTDLAERIWEEFLEARAGVLRKEHLVFVHEQQELHIGARGIFKCCSLKHLQGWFPEIMRTVATPQHLPLFTADVLLAIEDEAVLLTLFRRLPLLWLPTSSAVVALSTQGIAFHVASRQQRLLTAST